MAKYCGNPPPYQLSFGKKKPRKSAKQQVKECREGTINEAIQLMRDELRTKPKEWQRAYYSAITHLEMMKNG